MERHAQTIDPFGARYHGAACGTSGHMKDELEYKHCKTLEELRGVIDAYMRYYNCERKQWQRKTMTPVAYRNHLLSVR